MSGQIWIPGAERLTPSSGGGTMDFPESGPRAVAHTTECPSGPHNGDQDYWFRAMQKVLVGKSAEPNVLYDPVTDKLGQFIPLNLSGRALQNDGGRRTNRVGRVCIQIEFVGWASRPFTRTWTPGPNFVALSEAIASWGIPDVWPSGPPPAYPTEKDGRESGIWYSKAGWYGHSQVPANSHGDPGALSVPEFFRRGQGPESDPGSAVSKVWPGWSHYPGRAKLGAGQGKTARVNLLIKAALVVNGYEEAFRDGPIKPAWDDATNKAVIAFQKARKISEEGVGSKTWAALGRMPNNAPDFPGVKRFDPEEATLASLNGQSVLALQGFAETLGWQLTQRWRPAAQRATRRFQLSEPRLKADPDGTWGPLTWKLAWTDAT